MNIFRRVTARHGFALAAVMLAAGVSTGARAEGEGTANYMPDRVAEILMEQARTAGMTACEAILVPVGTDGTFRLTYRVTRAGQPQVARPANGMSAVVQSSACPR
jgi:tartrate dehydratase alpha subunit/fumarate hydratase class I-like protein